jgi:hypothetical protein
LPRGRLPFLGPPRKCRNKDHLNDDWYFGVLLNENPWDLEKFEAFKAEDDGRSVTLRLASPLPDKYHSLTLRTQEEREPTRLTPVVRLATTERVRSNQQKRTTHLNNHFPSSPYLTLTPKPDQVPHKNILISHPSHGTSTLPGVQP